MENRAEKASEKAKNKDELVKQPGQRWKLKV